MNNLYIFRPIIRVAIIIVKPSCTLLFDKLSLKYDVSRLLYILKDVSMLILYNIYLITMVKHTYVDYCMKTW